MRTNYFTILGLFLSTMFLSSCVELSTASPNPTLASPSPTPATSSETLGKIAYIGADQNIYIYDTQTDQHTPITKNRGTQNIYRTPSWSPDGTKLVFSESTPFSEKLYSYDLATQEHLELYKHGSAYVIYPYWAPNSQYISLLTNSNTPDLALHWINANNGESDILLLGQPFYWTISPNSQRVFYHVNASFVDGGMVGILDPSQEQDLAPAFPIDSGTFLSPQWAANDHIFTIYRDFDQEKDTLIALNPDGEIIQTYAEGLGRFAFSLSPDERYLAVIKNDIFNEHVFRGRIAILDADSGEAVFTSPDENAVAFFWSPDNTKLVYFTFNLPDDDNLESSLPNKTAAPTNQQEIILSVKLLNLPDFETVTLETNFIASSEFLQLLGFFDQYHRSDTIWSPDSSKLVLSGKPAAEDYGVWIYDVSTLEKEWLSDGELAFWSWQ